MSLLTGIVGYWKFDENTGSSVVDSVNANNGTWQGTLGSQWGTGIINSGGVLNGSNNSVQITSATAFSFSGAQAFSVNVWVKGLNNTHTGAYKPFISKNTGSSTNGGYWILREDSDSKIDFGFSKGSGQQSDVFSVTTSFDNTLWYMLTGTWDGTTGANSQKIYINGVLDNQATAQQTTILSNSTNLQFGRFDSNSAFFNGQEDEPAIWNVALSQADITSLYNGGMGMQYPFSLAVGALLSRGLPYVY